MEVSPISYCERYHLSPQIITVIYWELCNVPDAFKTSFIFSSPFSPPLNGSGHRWQQTVSWMKKAVHMSYTTPPQAHLKMQDGSFFLLPPSLSRELEKDIPFWCLQRCSVQGCHLPCRSFRTSCRSSWKTHTRPQAHLHLVADAGNSSQGLMRAKCLHLFQTPH